MAFDGITLHTIIDELKVLINGKVNKIYEPNSNNIIVSIYNNKSTYMLSIDTSANNYSIYLSTHLKENPLNAPNFCMTLRKYLMSSKITNIYMNGLERICYIDFECYNEMNDMVKRTLVVELMGKYSNIILLNENQMIIDALKKFDSESNFRDIMPARKYLAPDITKLDFTSASLKDFTNAITASEYETLETAIPNTYNGICKMFVQSVLEELHLSNTISAKSLKDIYEYINKILSGHTTIKKYKNNYSIYSSFNDNSKISCDEDNHFSDDDNHSTDKNSDGIDNHNKNYKDIDSHSTDKSSDSIDNHNKTQILSSNFFLDDFYYDKYYNEQYIQYRNSLLKVINGTLDRVLKKMDNINQKISLCENMNTYKLYGELLIANAYRFKGSLSSDVHELSVENYYDSNAPISIPVDNTKSVTDNAENYFKKYNKMKSTLDIVSIQKKETNKELDYLESLIEEMDRCDNISDVDAIYNEISENILFSDIKVKNKKGKSKSADISSLQNYIKLTIDGFSVYIGKNNKQNDYITFKIAKDNDLWFHTKDIHGSHLILKSDGITPKISTIEKCAKLCAYHSKARFSSHVPVDYALRKFVKKPRGSAPGFVVYTNNKTIYVDPSQFVKNQ